MSEWPFATLEQLCAEGGGFIKTGPFGSQLHRSDYIDDPDGIPVVMPKNMLDGRIDLADIARIGVDTADRLSQHLLSENDVVLSRRGDVGRSVWIEQRDLPAFCGTGSMRVHLGSPVSIHPEYLRYFFRSKLSSDYLEAHAVGATMPNLNTTIVGSLPVPVPPLDVQIAVSRLLSLFDDLVENNRRRIELLESMARAIYREWFVHFRFPGHEDVAMVDSDLGPIPEGWQVSIVGDVLELKYGKALKAGDRKGGDVAVVGSSGVVGWHDTALIPGPAVVVGRKGNVGSVTWVDNAVWPIDTTYYVATELPLRFVAEQLSRIEFLNTHAAVPGLSRDQAYSKHFIVPNDALLTYYENTVSPLFRRAQALEHESRVLSEMRDVLLPKLVSGEIDVSGLDLDGVIDKDVVISKSEAVA